MFLAMMTNFGFGHEIETLKVLFWVLDLDDSGTVDFIELVMGIHMLSQSTIKEKLNTFYELADADGNGSIDMEEMFNVLRRSYEKKSNSRVIWKMVDTMFLIADKNKSKSIS